MKIKNCIAWFALAGLPLLYVSYANAQCTVLNASPTSFSFPASGGSGSVNVQTDPSGCTDYSFSQVGTFFTATKISSGISISCNVNTTTFSRSGRVNAGDIVIQVNQAAACATQNPPGPVTGTNTVCQGVGATYSTTPVSGAISYTWSGGTIVSGQGTLSAVISFPTSGSKTVSVVAKNSCGSQSTAKSMTVTVVAPPLAPTDISNNPILCVGNNYTFSVTYTQGYSYEWTVEGTNFQILSDPTASSVNVKIGSGTGTIKVKAVNSTGCKSPEYSEQVTGEAGSPIYNVSGNGSICPGASTNILLDGSATGYSYTAYRNDVAIQVLSGNNSSLTFGPITQEGTYTIKSTSGNCPVPMNGSVVVVFKPAIPDQPGAITPTASTLCINGTAGFSIAGVPRATNYTWSAPAAIVVTGQGTTGAQITFNSSGNPITVSVTASNECGTSPARTIPVNVVANPSAPTSISHNTALCIGNDYTFSVTDSGLNYEWVVEGTNYQLLAGQNTSSINVRIGTGTGTIRVKAVNSTGCKSQEYSKQVTGEAASPIFNVSGNGSICPGASTNILLDGSTTGYTYTAFRNDQVVSGEATSAVIVLSGNNSSLTFGPFTQEGTYTIKSTSGNCPVPMNGSVIVAFKPAIPDQPGVISGTIKPVCDGSTSTFSIVAVPRATQYTWSVIGGSVTSQTGLEAQIRLATTAGSSTLLVTANNECGSSVASTKLVYVTYVQTPSFLSSNPNPCAGEKYTYSVDPVGGYTYEWETPEGWEILGGQGGSSVQIKTGKYDGTLKVTAKKNGCSSQTSSLFIDIVEPPAVFGLTGTRVICEGESFNLNLSGSVIGYDYSLMAGETTITTKPGTNGPLTFGPYSTPGTYKVYSSLSGGCPYPMDGEVTITAETLSVDPTSITATAYETCTNENVILTVFGGILGKGATWKWYTGACSGSAIGTGNSISVKPQINTTYYVRAEGTCNITACASISITTIACLDRANFNYTRVRTPQKSGYITLPPNPTEDTCLQLFQVIPECLLLILKRKF